MANITYDSHEEVHTQSRVAQIGIIGFYYVTALTMVGLTVMAGANFVVAGAIRGLVAVLGGV